MGRLPKMVYGNGNRKTSVVEFGGMYHRDEARNGEIYDLMNISADALPILRPVKPEKRAVFKNEKLIAIKENGEDFWAITAITASQNRKAKLYKNGIAKSNWNITSAEEEKAEIIRMSGYLILMPWKKIVKLEDGSVFSMDKRWPDSGSGAITIHDGTYAGEEADANTITATGIAWADYFSAEDCVEISGCTAHPENNGAHVIREIDGANLRFYENEFVIGEGGDEESAVVIERTAPAMRYLCQNENRLWATDEDGKEIYASALGDPTNWKRYDGVGTDSYAVTVGSGGSWTGCVSYMGYPIFFKENHIYKVYGDRPSNFQVLASASLGVAEGEAKSLAIAGETLFYLSKTGIMAYTGGIPSRISAALGDGRFRSCVAGSDGRRFHVCMVDQSGAGRIYLFDTEQKVWTTIGDGDQHIVGWIYIDGLIRAGNEGQSGEVATFRYDERADAPQGATETAVQSVVEFGDFDEDYKSTSNSQTALNHKGITRLQLRAEVEDGGTLTVWIQYDSDGKWRKVQKIGTGKKQSFVLPIIPRRCDHFRLKLEGVGAWSVFSMTREFYRGSEI